MGFHQSLYQIGSNVIFELTFGSHENLIRVLKLACAVSKTAETKEKILNVKTLEALSVRLTVTSTDRNDENILINKGESHCKETYIFI